MSPKRLLASLDGLMAHDLGAVDSGIRDEALKKQCREEIQSNLAGWTPVLRTWVLGYLEPPYGYEGALVARGWLRSQMSVEIDCPV